MKNMMIVFISFMFWVGGAMYISYRKHLLTMLMSLEFMVLSLFFFLSIYLFYLNYQLFMAIVYLVFSVCEGVLGLSILVSLIRSHGNDYFNSFGIL